jgi:hypothetical protein
MSDEERDRKIQAPVEGAEEEDDESGSPFDHPAFLPAVLWPMAAWFGYDGWINQYPDMLEHLTFNRWGFGVLVVLGIYFTVQAVREMRRSDDGPDA